MPIHWRTTSALPSACGGDRAAVPCPRHVPQAAAHPACVCTCVTVCACAWCMRHRQPKRRQMHGTALPHHAPAKRFSSALGPCGQAQQWPGQQRAHARQHASSRPLLGGCSSEGCARTCAAATTSTCPSPPSAWPRSYVFCRYEFRLLELNCVSTKICAPGRSTPRPLSGHPVVGLCGAQPQACAGAWHARPQQPPQAPPHAAAPAQPALVMLELTRLLMTMSISL